MYNLLYVDLPFIGEKGGDKNRSNFLWNALQKQFNCSLLLVKTHQYIDKPFPQAPGKSYRLIAERSNSVKSDSIFHYNPQQLVKFREIITSNNFDYIFFRFTSHAELMDEAAKCCPRLKIIVDVDMLFSRIADLSWGQSPGFRNRYYFVERLKLKRFESILFTKPYLFLFSNSYERDLIYQRYGRDLPQENYGILPNTVQNMEIPESTKKERSILFFGTLNSVANSDAVVHLSENIYPYLESYLQKENLNIYVVGKGPLDEMNKYYKEHLKLVGPVDDIIQVIVDSELIVLPIRIASGTRTRILEAGILAKPIVTTTIGAEGFNFNPEELIIEDDARKFAEEVIRLMENKESAETLGRNLRAKCQAEYTWEAVGQNLCRMIKESTGNNDGRKNKIAIVTNRFYPEVGGAETNIYFQAKELANRGHSVTVFCPKRIDRPKREKYDGIEVRRMDDVFNKPPTFPNIKAATLCPSLLPELLFGKFDVVMMFPAYNYNNLLAFMAGKLSGKPMILCSFDYLDYATIIKTEGKVPKDALERNKPRFHHEFFMRNMDFIFAIANKEIDLYRKYNNHVGYSPVPILLKEYEKEIDNPRKAYNIDTEFVFLSLGRISNIKGQDLALKAFVKVSQEIAEAKLVFVGRSDYEPQLLEEMKAIITANNLTERVIFTGMVERDEVLGWLKYSDIHIIPVRFMNSGAVVVESWISGIPVIQSDIVDPNLVVEDVNGFLFESENIEELSEKMIKSYRNRATLKEMAGVGEQLVREKYTYEYLCELYESAFSAIVKK
ncbi:MAG: glycosyltransferase [Candidatus Cloacimonetes bacterium]|nr:glycosyltransferase [Candidatus Cloacimonadota bacterium]